MDKIIYLMDGLSVMPMSNANCYNMVGLYSECP